MPLDDAAQAGTNAQAQMGPIESRSMLDTSPAEALLRTKDCLEADLAQLEAWRALKQLEARETAGEWFDVVESDVLRDRLVKALSAEPIYLAWQFVEIAIDCLAGGAGAVEQPHEALPENACALAAPAAAPPHAAMGRTATVSVPGAETARELATRIPTLQLRDGRSARLTAPIADGVTAAMPPPAANSAPMATHARPVAQSGDDAADLDDTLFDARAIGIEEADVQIVARPAPARIIETRLPPLPLTERGARLPRVSRSTAVKWADQADDDNGDYRPVSSAMDEAQVTILDLAAKSEAQSRAERRALGVAPDREGQMRRFLRALSGE